MRCLYCDSCSMLERCSVLWIITSVELLSRGTSQGLYKPIVLKIGPRKRPVVLPPKGFSDAPITKRRSIIAPNVRDNFPEHPNRAPFAICIYFFQALSLDKIW